MAGRRLPCILGIVTDLDGTLLRSDGTLSPASTTLLDTVRSLGLPLVVATARTPRAVRKIAGHTAFGRMVCANGAVVWDACSDAVVSETCFSPAALGAAVGRLKEALPDVGFALLTAQTMFVDAAYLALRSKKEGVTLVPDVERVAAGLRVVAVAVRHPRVAADVLVGPASEAFAAVGMASFAGGMTVDISPRAVTKAVAVSGQLAEAGCPADSIAVFGDMPNDLPLFAWAGWACAVANSHPDVLAAADEIIPSNDDDGVARTVRRLLRL